MILLWITVSILGDGYPCLYKEKESMNIINENLIELDVSMESKDDVIKTIARLLAMDGRINNEDVYIADVYERESIVPTSIGNLIAIPHALSNAVNTASLVFIRLSHEIQWNDTDQAKYVFGIAVPKENRDNQHLKILSQVARKMLDDDFKAILFESIVKSTLVTELLRDG